MKKSFVYFAFSISRSNNSDIAINIEIKIFCTLFVLVIFCPSSLENAVLSPDCLRRSGDSCSYFCAQGYVSSTINKLLCTSEGVWNTDTTTLCSSKMSKNQWNAIENYDDVVKIWKK